MFSTNNRVLFHLWRKENLVKHQKASKCYENDCISKLKPYSDVATGTINCNSRRCKICEILVPGKEFNRFVTKKTYIMNFRFDCNSSEVIYLIFYAECGGQYTNTTITRFRERFNQCKSNLNLCSQGVSGVIFDFECNG